MKHLALLPPLLLLLLTTAGCEDSVHPSLGIDRPFTLWGMINPKTDTHAVRIFETQETIRLIQPDPIDAVVHTTDLTTGEVVAWRDSVVRLADGDYRHVYYAIFKAPVAHTYQLEVRRSDGATSRARVTVPPPVTLEILEPNLAVTANTIQPVFVHGDPPALPRIDLEYETVSFNDGDNEVTALPVTISYAGRPERTQGGWLIELDLRADFIAIRQQFADRDFPTGNIEAKSLELRVHVGDETWVSPIGVFDADFLVEPGVFSNVENGFGFFGAGYLERIRFRPPDQLMQRAGFTIGG